MLVVYNVIVIADYNCLPILLIVNKQLAGAECTHNITRLRLIKASVTLQCEVIVSHGFNICFDEKPLAHGTNPATTYLFFYIYR